MEKIECCCEHCSHVFSAVSVSKHRLLCGDATSEDDLKRLMSGEVPGTILTDPPYGMDLDTDFSGMKGSPRFNKETGSTGGKTYRAVIGDDKQFDPSPIVNAFQDVAEQFWWGADYYADRIPGRANGSWLVWDKRTESQADGFGSEFELCWSRTRHKRRMLRHDWFGFLSSANADEAQNRLHPTQKPVTLLTDILNQWGNGGIVADFYGGSGSTLIACEQLNRTCYMMEIDPQYVDVIVARWEKFTGQEARLEREATA